MEEDIKAVLLQIPGVEFVEVEKVFHVSIGTDGRDLPVMHQVYAVEKELIEKYTVPFEFEIIY